LQRILYFVITLAVCNFGYSCPQVYLKYTGTSVIGGPATIEAVDTTGAGIESVDWIIEDAAEAQKITKQKSATQKLPARLNTSPKINFWWGSTPGEHHIMAICHLKNMRADVEFLTINIQSPKVVTFRNDYQKNEFRQFFRFGPKIGFVQWNQNKIEGNIFRAIIKTPIDGRFAVIQLVQSDDAVKNIYLPHYSCNTNKNFVLDTLPEWETPFYNDWVSHNISPAEDLVPLPDKGQVLVDSPAVWTTAINYFSYSMKKDMNFQTHLMFCPKDGIWVSVNRIEWSVQAEAEFSGDWHVRKCYPDSCGTKYGIPYFCFLNWGDRLDRIIYNK
jgi:hypothetical protein